MNSRRPEDPSPLVCALVNGDTFRPLPRLGASSVKRAANKVALTISISGSSEQ
jgi:hypothetical protein